MSSEVGIPWGGLGHLMQSITERERMHSSSGHGEGHLWENYSDVHHYCSVSLRRFKCTYILCKSRTYTPTLQDCLSEQTYVFFPYQMLS